MKRLLILIIFFAGCKRIPDTDLIGVWIGHYKLEVQLDQEPKKQYSDTLKFDELFENATIADSAYNVLVNVLEFLPNGKNNSLNDNFADANWTYSKGHVNILTDSMEITGTISDSILNFEIFDSGAKVILNYRKVKAEKKSGIESSNLIGNYFEIIEKDSITSTCYFRDSSIVFLNGQYGLIPCRYYFGTLNGITCINIPGNYITNISGLYLFESTADKLYVIKERELGFKQPIWEIAQIKKLELLTQSNKADLTNKLNGTWISTPSFVQLSNQNQDGKISNLTFKLEISGSDLNIKISGVDLDKKRKYELEQCGKWNLSATGEFLEFKHNGSYRNHPNETVNYITINSISDSSINIGYRYFSLYEQRNMINDKQIELERE